ncbi:DUF2851 family protein [Flavobacterium sp. ST-75]|uniref:DUF2851 family protein n=1 Tax=Flavobacterium rhizophilum TaxID=3163296 RepID=A0ABW8YHF7_9FLAO
MKEDFLHYLWQFKKFDILNLHTVKGEKIEIINSGQYLQQAGPDFFNARLAIGNQKWAGNVEIHLKSSDWYIHNHENDSAYDNVVLHVVWEHDTEVYRKDNTEIPVLQLKDFTDKATVENYRVLTTPKTWIYCEKELASINSFVMSNWKDRLFFERLERKSKPILELATETANDWEAVLFCFLAKNFGLNTNGEVFYELAKSIPFAVIRKEAFEAENLEALFMGRAGLLKADKQDMYFKDLKSRFDYITHKHRLPEVYLDELQFFKLRPDNFPTIRLSQLAQLYHLHQNLFSKLIEATSLQDIYDLFTLQVSEYWKTHYQFDKESTKKRKALSPAFIDLLIINTIVPFKFAYNRHIGKETDDEVLDLLTVLKSEKNAVIDKFRFYKVAVESAFDSQALLQLKKEYCDHKKCMQCALGLELIKS